MLKTIVISCIKGYQQWISPLMIFFGGVGGSCRFIPTCSEYAVQAVQEHGVVRGTFLGFRRILRCQPWGGHGYDPVPSDLNKTGKLQEPTCSCGSEKKHLEHFNG